VKHIGVIVRQISLCSYVTLSSVTAVHRRLQQLIHNTRHNIPVALCMYMPSAEPEHTVEQQWHLRWNTTLDPRAK